MRWRGRKRSGNVEDRRGMPVGKVAGGGVGLLILVVAALVLGVDPTPLLTGGGGAPAPGATGERGAPDDSAGARVAVVLASTEDTWRALFAEAGRDYREPTLVLFDEAVHSACGMAGSAVGPFYCPGDGQVYMDLSFFNALADRYGASGDFAQAYVVAHEVGHHVQNLLGTSDRVRREQQGASRADANALSVRLELRRVIGKGSGPRATIAGAMVPGLAVGDKERRRVVAALRRGGETPYPAATPHAPNGTGGMEISVGGLGRHGLVSVVGVPRRSYGYAFGTPPRNRGRGAPKAARSPCRSPFQADCYAGVWASYAADERNFLEEGDIEEALGAASAIGDDALQRRSEGTVVPESFTHGTSAQRVRWFRTGLSSGDPDACDTFSATSL